MKDVAALCQRVVIIAQGQIMYDGSLAGIIDRFSGHKVVTLQFADDSDAAATWPRSAKCSKPQPPKVKLRVERNVVAEVLAAILAEHTVEDVSVEDPPLEEVIAEMFSLVDAAREAEAAERAVGRSDG